MWGQRGQLDTLYSLWPGGWHRWEKRWATRENRPAAPCPGPSPLHGSHFPQVTKVTDPLKHGLCFRPAPSLVDVVCTTWMTICRLVAATGDVLGACLLPAVAWHVRVGTPGLLGTPRSSHTWRGSENTGGSEFHVLASGVLPTFEHPQLVMQISS